MKVIPKAGLDDVHTPVKHDFAITSAIAFFVDCESDEELAVLGRSSI